MGNLKSEISRADIAAAPAAGNTFAIPPQTRISPSKAGPRRTTGSKSQKTCGTRDTTFVRRMLDPGEIITNGAQSSLAESWDWFSGRLASAGFESCGFLISRQDADSPLSDHRSRLFGNVVSTDYLNFVRANPDKQAQARPYRRLRTSRTPVTYLSDADLKEATPSERALAAEINDAFGIKGWALFPVQSPEKNRVTTIGWWDLHDQKEARRLWAAEGSSFILAATYFCESVRTLIDQEDPAPSAALSNREIECLLWAGAGKTTGEIAGILNVADGTVEEYFKRAAKKLGASTRAQACVRAILAGIIRP